MIKKGDIITIMETLTRKKARHFRRAKSGRKTPRESRRSQAQDILTRQVVAIHTQRRSKEKPLSIGQTVRFARRLRFACFLFGQNTEHVHADAAISRRVDKPDLLVTSLQGLGKLKRRIRKLEYFVRLSQADRAMLELAASEA